MEFRTENLHFSCYLRATGKITFLRGERLGNRVVFVFADPHGEGPQLLAEFEGGAACSASSLFDSLRHLRRVVSINLNENMEKSPNGNNRYNAIR
jgi:hypothetical protein